MKGELQIYDLTKPELEKYREECNFSEDELKFFNARAQHKTYVQISVECYWSEAKVYKLNRAVKRKMNRL